MSLAIGIVGLPNVGKSTLFNALTKNSVLAANYPFATIEPNTGVVAVPDPRLAVLAELHGSARIVPATVSFVDIAGIVRGASEGQGLGNQFLANIREADAICQVVRAFSDPDVVHVTGHVDPADDIEIVHIELILADLQTLEKRRKRLEGDAKRDRATYGPALEAANKATEILDAGTTLYGASFDASALRDLHLLTAKPFIYVFNSDEETLADPEQQQQLTASVAPAPAVVLCAKIEAELADLPDAEALELLRSLGQERSGLDQLVTIGYQTLGLQTYLTAGPKEARAWTVRRGDTAPVAARSARRRPAPRRRASRRRLHRGRDRPGPPWRSSGRTSRRPPSGPTTQPPIGPPSASRPGRRCRPALGRSSGSRPRTRR